MGSRQIVYLVKCSHKHLRRHQSSSSFRKTMKVMDDGILYAYVGLTSTKEGEYI